MKQALAEQGIVGEGRSMTERAVWVQKEKEALAELIGTWYRVEAERGAPRASECVGI